MILERIEIATEIKDRHERWIVSGNELEEWIQSVKEELARWSDLSTCENDHDQLKKKIGKIDELKSAKATGAARLDATIILADQVQTETNVNGRELIKAEMANQQQQWNEWEEMLTETELNITAVLNDLEEYQDGYRNEKAKLEQILAEFNSSLEQIKVPTFDKNIVFPAVGELSLAEQNIKQLETNVTMIRTRLNFLCRRYANEDSEQISQSVATTLNAFSNTKQCLSQVRSQIEENFRNQFKTKLSLFDSYIRKYLAQIQQYTSPRGDLETIERALDDINRITTESVEPGNAFLKELNDMVDGSGSLISSEQGNLNRSSTRQLKEKWKNYLVELNEAKTGTEQYIQGLQEFDRNCFELYHWVGDIEKRLKVELGLRSTLGQKKSQLASLQTIEEEASDEQYKFARLKRRTNRVQYPGGTTKVGDLHTSYRAICTQAAQARKDASLRHSQHVTFVNDVSSAEKWIKERHQKLDELSDIQNVSKSELEKRLVVIRRIMNEQQAGENVFHLAIGRADAVYQGTSQNGIHAIELQVKSLQELWNSFINSLRHTEDRITLGLANWTMWTNSVASATSWLHKTTKILDEKVSDHTSDSDQSEATSPILTLHRLQSIVSDCHHHGKFSCVEQIEKQTKQLTSILGIQETAMVKQVEILEKFLALQNTAEQKLKECIDRADQDQIRTDTINEFKDWMGDQKLVLASLSEPTGALDEIGACLDALNNMKNTIIPHGDSRISDIDEDGEGKFVIDEWISLKKSILKQLKHVEDVKHVLENFIEKIDSFEIWVTQKMEILEDHSKLKINFDEDGKSNAAEVIRNFQAFLAECEEAKSSQEYLTKEATYLVESCRLELTTTVRVTELTAKYQNIVGSVKIRLAAAQNNASILSELTEKIELFDQWLSESTEKFRLTMDCKYEDENTVSNQIINSLAIISELINECEYKRGTLLGLTERCARATANVANSPLSSTTRENIQSQSAALQEDFQELHGKLQVAGRRLDKVKAHWFDYSDAEKKLTSYLAKVDKNLKKVSQPNKLQHLNEIKANVEELKNQIDNHQDQKDKVHEGEFRLGKLPLEIQDFIAPLFYKKQNMYRDIGRDLKKKYDDLHKLVEHQELFLTKLHAKEKQLIQLNERIVKLQEQIMNDQEEPIARESQANFLYQDAESFQQDIAELRALGMAAESKRQSDIQALAKAGSDMLKKIKEILSTCRQAAQESAERKTELIGFQTNLTKARNAIQNLPECSDPVQGSRQLSQLEDIRHDVAQISRECDELLSANPQSKKLKEQSESATEIEAMRSTKASQIETQIKNWEDESEVLNQIELWAQKKENELEAIFGDEGDEGESMLEAKQAQLEDIRVGAIKYLQTINENQSSLGQSDSLKNRLENLRDRAKSEQDELENTIELMKSINSELATIVQKTETFTSEFHSVVKNVSEAGNSTVRLEQFVSLQSRVQAEEDPVNKLAERVLQAKFSLQPTQYDNIQSQITDQKSRLVDLLARVENRKAHLNDVIKEKIEFEIKLNNFQTQIIDIESELESGIEPNVEIEKLRSQQSKALSLQAQLSDIKSEFDQLKNVQLKTVKVGLPEIEKTEVDCLIEEIESLLNSAIVCSGERLSEIDKLIKERTKLWQQGKEMDSWIKQAENKFETRLRKFPVNPDAMAKIISQYKSFSRELLARQKPLESLIQNAGSLQVRNKKSDGSMS